MGFTRKRHVILVLGAASFSVNCNKHCSSSSSSRSRNSNNRAYYALRRHFLHVVVVTARPTRRTTKHLRHVPCSTRLLGRFRAFVGNSCISYTRGLPTSLLSPQQPDEKVVLGHVLEDSDGPPTARLKNILNIKQEARKKRSD